MNFHRVIIIRHVKCYEQNYFSHFDRISDTVLVNVSKEFYNRIGFNIFVCEKTAVKSFISKQRELFQGPKNKKAFAALLCKILIKN